VILAVRLAWRDLRASGRALWLLALCLFTGTAALAGIGSLTASMLAALAGEGRQALGGDVELRVSQRRATIEELAAFRAAGRVAEVVTLRAMAGAPGRPAVLVDLKAVDPAWPLVGRFALAPGALAPRPRLGEVAVAPALAERLGVKPGDALRVGVATLRVAGAIAAEPDQLGAGFRLGPPAIVDAATLDRTGLIQPGSLFEARYRIALPPGTAPRAMGERLRRRFPGAGWTVRVADEATRGLGRTVTQLGQFLSLVGLAALGVAGIGIGSGVGAFLDGKARSIAVLKVLGARARLVAAAFAIELGAVAGLAIAAGLALGAATPWIVARVAGAALPVPPVLALFPRPLAVAALLGLLVTALFACLPLARAGAVPAASLLRGALAPSVRPRARALALVAVLAAAIALLAVASAGDRRLAGWFVGGVTAAVLVLALLGQGMRALAARAPRPRRPLARLALANLHRPGAQTARLVVALGLGLSLFVALAAVNGSLVAQVQGSAPRRAPRFFAVDLQPEDAARFAAAVRAASPAARIEYAPSLRGQVTGLKGVAVADMKPPPDSWVLRGDRTITWSARLPPHNRVVAGRWWPPGYRGPPLVSIGEDMARDLHLAPGDAMTLSILGVDVPVRVAAIRAIDWSALDLNFALVMSPGYIEEAPHALLAAVYSGAARDGQVAGRVAAVLPSVTLIRTGDVIGQVSDVLGQIVRAIRWAAGATVAAGAIVLVGAVAAGARTRARDTVVLKLAGATRGQVLLIGAIEWALLGAGVAVIAAALGLASAWAAVTQGFALPFAPGMGAVAATLALSLAAIVVVGLLAGLRPMRVRVAAALRDA